MNSLPIGSVVKLKSFDLLVMITGKLPLVKVKSSYEYYDFRGQIYPIGDIGQKETYCFNIEDVDKTVYKGYISEEDVVFNEFLESYTELYNLKKAKIDYHELQDDVIYSLDKAAKKDTNSDKSSISKLFN